MEEKPVAALLFVLFTLMTHVGRAQQQKLAEKEDQFLQSIESVYGSKQFRKDLKCNASGILCKCSQVTCYVTEIDWSSNGLAIQIPPLIGSFEFLERLDISYNELSGEIPESLGELKNLQSLDLSNNQLTGSIPSSLGNLKKLQNLSLRFNNLTGTIPAGLGRSQNLIRVDVSYNQFNGTDFDKVQNMTTLQYLYVLHFSPSPFSCNVDRRHHRYYGFLHFSLLKSITFAHDESRTLDGNHLSGKLPKTLGNLTNLKYLSLSYNYFTGELPSCFTGLKHMEEFYVDGNFLSGSVHNIISGWKNLTTLWLQYNHFTGNLSYELAELRNLESLVLNGNNFSGQTIPEVITSWTSLEFLELKGNNLIGPIPQGINKLKNLFYFELSDISTPRKQLFPDFGNKTGLRYLILRNCSIFGSIPEDLGAKMPYLRYLDLGINELSGQIPQSLSKLNLTSMFLSENKLSGSIPNWVTNSTTIKAVDFSDNNFTNVSFEAVQRKPQDMQLNLFACCSPSVPNLNPRWQSSNYTCADGKKQYDGLYINCGGKEVKMGGKTYEEDVDPHGAAYFSLSKSKRWGYSSTGSFKIDPKHVGNNDAENFGVKVDEGKLYDTARFSSISLKYYGFCLKNGNYEVELFFAEIVLGVGEGLDSIGKRVFDVFIQDKRELSDYNIQVQANGPNKPISRKFNAQVKNNKLEIHLYNGGKGSHGPLISAISMTRLPEAKNQGKDHRIVIAVTATLAFLLLLLMALAIWSQRRKGGLEELTRLELGPGGFFSFKQIKAATQNFSPANKIGEGGFGAVYKGVLANRTQVAVKQLSSKSKQGTHEFVNEVGTISALQHPHLVRLLGCCAQDNQLLLIYEYMENNCLWRALFGSMEHQIKLNWPTRLKICLGIAKGLAFLHEESKLKIIHRDIKSSNVLLDKDLNAKISDLGLAKLYEGEDLYAVSKVAGTHGYMAPEYAMRGHLTVKADVYSFGVVTLEIVSGKNITTYRPSEECSYLLDYAYVLHEKGSLLELVDPALGSDFSVEEVTRLLEVAMACTNPSPTLRPTMSVVVSILEGKTTMEARSFCPRFDHYRTGTALFVLSNASTSMDGIWNAEGEEIEYTPENDLPKISKETAPSHERHTC